MKSSQWNQKSVGFLRILCGGLLAALPAVTLLEAPKTNAQIRPDQYTPDRLINPRLRAFTANERPDLIRTQQLRDMAEQRAGITPSVTPGMTMQQQGAMAPGMGMQQRDAMAPGMSTQEPEAVAPGMGRQRPGISSEMDMQQQGAMAPGMDMQQRGAMTPGIGTQQQGAMAPGMGTQEPEAVAPGMGRQRPAVSSEMDMQQQGAMAPGMGTQQQGAMTPGAPMGTSPSAIQPPLPEQLQSPQARVTPQNQRVNVRVVNRTGANVVYQAIGDTDQRVLSGRSEVMLRDLATPMTLTFNRADGGLLRIQPRATSEAGMLEVALEETTDLGADRVTLRVQETGEVLLN